MGNERFVLIVESDAAARAQMNTVLAGMGAAVVEAGGLDTACAVAEGLSQAGTLPVLIVVRVTLPDGNGVEVLDRLNALFPHANYLLVSHFPKRLLFSLPGFASLRAEFLQAAFSDDEFRRVAERSLGRSIGA
jgi:CheY-like chemotaxis protein